MLGELALAEFFGALPDFRNRPWGDGKIDLELLLEIWSKLDAKGSPTPWHLIVAPKDVRADVIYVLCGPVNHLYVNTGHLNTVPGVGYLYDCLGWQLGSELMKQPLRSFGQGAPSHATATSNLNPMCDLKEMYRSQWRHQGCEPRAAGDLVQLGRGFGHDVPASFFPKTCR